MSNGLRFNYQKSRIVLKFTSVLNSSLRNIRTMRRMGSRGNELRRKQVAAFSNETIVVRECIGVVRRSCVKRRPC